MGLSWGLAANKGVKEFRMVKAEEELIVL